MKPQVSGDQVTIHPIQLYNILSTLVLLIHAFAISVAEEDLQTNGLYAPGMRDKNIKTNETKRGGGWQPWAGLGRQLPGIICYHTVFALGGR